MGSEMCIRDRIYKVSPETLHVLQRNEGVDKMTKRSAGTLEPSARSLTVDMGDMMEVMKEMNMKNNKEKNPHEHLLPLSLRNRVETLRNLSPECGYSNQILVLGEEGSVSSPGYPGRYPTERNCYWNLKVIKESSIKCVLLYYYISIYFTRPLSSPKLR